MKKYRQLISVHAHSHYSLDGAATVKQIIDRNVELGAPYVALTEHGNTASAMELYVGAKEAGVKPIVGIEAYMVNPFHAEYVEIYRKAAAAGLIKLRAKDPEKVEKELHNKAMGQYLHVTIHFKDEWAYKYFNSLSPAMWSRAVKKYDEEKPMVTLEELEKAAGHITITSSCLKGPVQSFLLPSRDGVIPVSHEKAEFMYNRLREISGKDSFYVEIFPHKVTHSWKKPELDYATKRIITPGEFVKHDCTCHAPDGDLQKLPNQFCLDMAAKYKDRAVISLDSHFAWPTQRVIQDARLGNGSENWRFYNSYHIMDTEEAAVTLKDQLGLTEKQIEEMVDNSYHFASHFDNFKIHTKKDKFVLESAPQDWLQQVKQKIDRHGRMNWEDPAMVTRLKKELAILTNNGVINLMPYFFTVEDVANFCRENDILMNVRGSAGGSLLLYLMGVSAINPLKHGLSFERFLTEGRIKAKTMPDADCDISDQEKVFAYLEQKYGDHFARISTDLMLKLKSSIKDAERTFLGFVRKETEDMCTRLPPTPQGMNDRDFVIGHVDSDGTHHPGLVFTSPALKQYALSNKDTWMTVVEMMGIQRGRSVHACGIVIADRPLTEYTPLIYPNGTKATGYSPKSVENAGLIKYDFLGLNTLRDIQDCLRSIKSRTGETIDPWVLPQMKECYDQFAKGHTETVFQFDTDTVRPYLVNIHPKSLDELAAVTALCRPGTLDAPSGDGRTLADVYVARAKGERTTYAHPDLEPILKETVGIALYQEQTLEIFKKIGGFSDEEAEDARRAIGKKDAALLDRTIDKLKSHAMAHGWTESQVALLRDQIMASAKYSFNKSHAISYSYVAYACMYLKTFYPLDWWKAILSNASKEEFATKFWKYAQDFVVLPDINRSSKDFTIVGDKLICPISILTGVGPKAYEQLTSGAPYTDLKHFVETHLRKREKGDRSSVTQPMVEKLVVGGILDSLFAQDYPDADTIEKKLQILEDLKSEIRGEWSKGINPAYVGMTELGRYMVKKQLVPVYSLDLRNILLPSRGGRAVAKDCIVSTPESKTMPVMDGNQIQAISDRFAQGSIRLQGYDVDYVAAVGYVLQEKAKDYKNKTKRANALTIDINGFFFNEILWPDYEADEAPMGFKGLPCLLIYKETAKRFSLVRVQPLIERDEIKNYTSME